MRKMSMSMIIITVMSASLVAAAKPAAAHHLPSSDCSPSGDICQSVRKVDGVRRLKIVTAAKYFDEFDLCVYAHRPGYEWCAPYELRQRANGTWGRSVAWFKEWPSMRHRGRFTVSWWVGSTRIGSRLGLHRRQ